MPDTIPFCAPRKMEIDNGQGNEEKGRQEVLTRPARVVTDSRRLPPVDPETLFSVGAISAKTI